MRRLSFPFSCRRRFSQFVLLPLFGLTLLAGPGANAGPPSKSKVLPVERVRMYETGVAYFHRAGHMSAGRDLQLPLPAGHLDDALKTLVVLSPGGQAKFGGVAFESAVSEGAARAFAGLPEQGADRLDYDVVLRAFEGQRVEVSLAKERVKGRLLEVQGPLAPAPLASDADGGKAKANSASAPREQHWNLVVLDDDGAVRRLRTDKVKGVRPLDAGAAERIEIAAASLSGQKAQRSHSLSLQVQRPGKVELGYVAEAPVWRTSYRVVLTNKGQAVMQAWALIHNDTDEGWSDVDIELANGEPTSFLFPMAAPRYARRELRAPEVDLFTVPQLLLETVDGMWADGTGLGYGVGGGSVGAGGLGISGYGRGGGGSASGSVGLGSVGHVGVGSLELGDLADFAQADGSESEAQFVYKLAESVDLPAHHSALVPVFARSIDAQSISLFNEAGSEAMHGLRLVNSTRQPLPAGTIALFADGGFSGEASLDRLKPGEPRYLSFGRDLDVELRRTRESKGQELRALTFSGDAIQEHFVDRFDIVLRVDNRASRTRKAYISLNLPRNAQLQSEAPLDWDPVQGKAMVSFDVEGHTHARTRVEAGTAGSSQHPALAISAEKLRTWAKLTALGPKTRRALANAAQADEEAVTEDERIVKLRAATDERMKELSRRRRDLAAMASARNAGEASRKTSKRIAELEEMLEAHRKKIAKAEMARTQARARKLDHLRKLPASLSAAKARSAGPQSAEPRVTASASAR